MKLFSRIADLFGKKHKDPVVSQEPQEEPTKLDEPTDKALAMTEKDLAIRKILANRLEGDNIHGFLETLKKFPIKEEMLADRGLIELMWKIFDERRDEILYEGDATYLIDFVRKFKISQEEINHHVRDLVLKRINEGHFRALSSETIDLMNRLNTDRSLMDHPEVKKVVKEYFDPHFNEYAPWVAIFKVFKFDESERNKILYGLLEHYAYERGDFYGFEDIWTAFGETGEVSNNIIVDLYIELISRGFEEGVLVLDKRFGISEKYVKDEVFDKRMKIAALNSLEHFSHTDGVAEMKKTVEKYGLVGNEIPLADIMPKIKQYFLYGEPNEAFYLGKFVGVSEEELKEMALQSFTELEPGSQWRGVVDNLEIYVPKEKFLSTVQRLYLESISGKGVIGPWTAMEMVKKYGLPDTFLNSDEALAAANEGYLKYLAWDNGSAEAILKMYPSVG